ncbi:MAG: alpha/beta hydrolase family protein [bacterium]
MISKRIPAQRGQGGESAMRDRNLSPQRMFQMMAAELGAQDRFAGSTAAEFRSWHKATLPKVLATLGDFPERVPLRPELIVEWEEGGLRKQRWWLNVQKHLSAVLLVAWPVSWKPADGQLPAILCCHGHGPFGKEVVMGNASSPEYRKEIDGVNYDYGRQMAEKGFFTYAIDWIGFGERNDASKPNHLNLAGGRDWCNLYYLHATMLGMTSLSINVTHGMAATDFVSSLPQVDRKRLGVMGLSGGGTMSLWMSLVDQRIRATEIICYSDLWADMGIRDINYCGMQVAPGLYKLVDIPDLQGLLAPRPLLVDIGVYDSCFRIESAMACYRRVAAIYAAAGASQRLELDLHPDNHSWGNRKACEFFQRYLP